MPTSDTGAGGGWTFIDFRTFLFVSSRFRAVGVEKLVEQRVKQHHHRLSTDGGVLEFPHMPKAIVGDESIEESGAWR